MAKNEVTLKRLLNEHNRLTVELATIGQEIRQRQNEIRKELLEIQEKQNGNHNT